MMTLIILTFESLRPQIILPRIPKISISVADRDLHIRGGPVIHTLTLMGGGGRSQNRFFSAFRASVWSKNKGRRAPSLDPPLKMIYARIRTDPVCQFSNLSRVTGTELGMYSADPQ